jgi:uncharacterized protein (TIGR02301 family)
MGQAKKGCLGLLLGALCAVWASTGSAPPAKAQFFWWLDQQPKKAAPAKPRATRPKPPGDDLPPIVPRESSAPPPPDDRPYDTKLMRLAEILGAIHYLRELCGAQEGQIWRDQMKEILRNEGTTAVRRAKLVNSFNDGYRGYRRTYRSCTQSATLATTRFSTEGATIAASLAQGSSFAAKGPAAGAKAENDGGAMPASADETEAGASDGAGADLDQTGGLPPVSQAAVPPPETGDAPGGDGLEAPANNP